MSVPNTSTQQVVCISAAHNSIIQDDSVCCVQGCCTWHCDLERCEQQSCAQPMRNTPHPQVLYKAAPLGAFHGECVLYNKTSGLYILCSKNKALLVAQMVKRLPTMWETWVQSLGREDPLEKKMATHSSTLAWRIPWKEEPGGLKSMGLQRVGHDWATSLSLPLCFWTKLSLVLLAQTTSGRSTLVGDQLKWVNIASVLLNQFWRPDQALS